MKVILLTILSINVLFGLLIIIGAYRHNKQDRDDGRDD